jgi:hypothetical protein
MVQILYSFDVSGLHTTLILLLITFQVNGQTTKMPTVCPQVYLRYAAAATKKWKNFQKPTQCINIVFDNDAKLHQTLKCL